MAVQRVFCVFCGFCVSPFSYAWCVSYAWRVAYWRMVCGFCSDSNAASYLPADACARTSHAHFESQLTSVQIRMPPRTCPLTRVPASDSENRRQIGVT